MQMNKLILVINTLVREYIHIKWNMSPDNIVEILTEKENEHIKNNNNWDEGYVKGVR